MAFWDYFFKKKSDSATHAVDRIKFVLQSDRTGLPPETLERIKNDIISVLSKYVDIETAELDFNITKAPSESGAMTPALCANIPIKGVKRNVPAADASKTEAKPAGSVAAKSSPAAGSSSSDITAKSGQAAVSGSSADAAKSVSGNLASGVQKSGASSDASKGQATTENSKNGVSSETVRSSIASESAKSDSVEVSKAVASAARSAETAAKSANQASKIVDENPELGSALDKTFTFKK